MSYVREQAILSFTHRTEQESKKKKTVVCKEQIIELAHMRLSIGKKEKKKRETETKFHSFIHRRKKPRCTRRKKISLFLRNF